MLSINKILSYLKQKRVSSEGNYSYANFYYKTNDKRKFCVSENGWHMINKTNKFTDNKLLSNLQSTMLSSFLNASTIYNYFIHPSTMEKTKGDHILITVAKPENMITKDNLERSRSELIKHFSQTTDNYEKFELELIARPTKPKLFKSAYARVYSKNIVDEYVSIPTSKNCVVVSCSTSPRNRDHYKRIMFQIVDSIDLSL